MALLDTQPPDFDEADARQLAANLYGIDGNAKSLDSERDRNFRVHTSRQRFVLKIANAAESEQRLICENAALAHARQHDPSLPVPYLIAARDGKTLTEARDAQGRRHLVRLLSYLPGVPLAAITATAALHTQLGMTLGRLASALQDFQHPAAHRAEFIWNLDEVAHIAPLVRHIANAETRAHVEQWLDRYQKTVQPQLETLPSSVIYNDANDHNILVEDGEISGIIDFGDLVLAKRVNDIAVALAYVMLDKPDPLASAVQVLTGYHAYCPLLEAELAVLFDLIALRLATSLCVSSWRGANHPANAYLLVSQQPAQAMLKRFAGMNLKLVRCALRKACGLSPVRI